MVFSTSKVSQYYLMVFLLLLASGQLRAEVNLQESFNYYSVTPSEGQSLRIAIRSSSPIAKNNKVRFGRTSWNVVPDYKWREFPESCYLSKPEVYLTITFTLPQLNMENPPKALQKQFDIFYDALYQHELGHKSLGLEAANEIYRLLSGIRIFNSCKELNQTLYREINAIINKYMELNRDYDIDTDFGRTQGAVIKEVIVVK